MCCAAEQWTMGQASRIADFYQDFDTMPLNKLQSQCSGSHDVIT
jgi:hypothetical protein